jgi:N-acetyl-gamma-glutamyl-phosphate reductase
VFPHLRHLDLPTLCRIEEIDFAGIDLVFCALPHATSQAVIRELPADLKIVDLSADFRLRDPAAYEKWYGKPHAAPDLQAEAVYGLTEFYRDEIRAARLVAGTGCNAATGQYALRPLIAEGVIDLDEIIIDLKAAVSGAGRRSRKTCCMPSCPRATTPMPRAARTGISASSTRSSRRSPGGRWRCSSRRT